jgi:hypothetical protein
MHANAKQPRPAPLAIIEISPMIHVIHTHTSQTDNPKNTMVNSACTIGFNTMSCYSEISPSVSSASASKKTLTKYSAKTEDMIACDPLFSTQNIVHMY